MWFAFWIAQHEGGKAKWRNFCTIRTSDPDIIRLTTCRSRNKASTCKELGCWDFLDLTIRLTH